MEWLVWAVALVPFPIIEARRGPHHPREAPLPPGARLAELERDASHIQEDVGPELDVDAMTDEELDFYYFRSHDFDKDGLLDGLEMLKAANHRGDGVEPTERELDIRIGLIDEVLERDDLDGDGFLSYAEYAYGKSNARILTQ